MILGYLTSCGHIENRFSTFLRRSKQKLVRVVIFSVLSTSMGPEKPIVLLVEVLPNYKPKSLVYFLTHISQIRTFLVHWEVEYLDSFLCIFCAKTDYLWSSIRWEEFVISIEITTSVVKYNLIGFGHVNG